MTRLCSKVLKLINLTDTSKASVKIVQWMQRKGILRRQMRCGQCLRRMHLRRVSTQDGLMWMCRRGHRPKSTSVRSGSIFYRSQKSLKQWLHFIYRFSQGLRLRQLDFVQDGVARSSTTLSKMAKAMRKVCIKAVHRLKRHGMAIGTAQKFVVLDESKFAHKRKYNRGRFRETWRRRRSWVFGMMEVGHNSRKPILRIVKNRSRRRLLPIIQCYVQRGTAILSDEWRAYRGALEQSGYSHYTVCHNREFVNSVNGTHTQHIERAWGTYKAEIWRHRGNRSQKLLKQHLRCIEWHHWLATKHREGVIGRLLHDIKKCTDKVRPH